MTTPNRPTARTPNPAPAPVPPATSLAGLTSRVRRLWARDLGVLGREREGVLVELAELDLTIERLSMRAASGQFRVSDGALAEECRRRVGQFEALWDRKQRPAAA